MPNESATQAEIDTDLEKAFALVEKDRKEDRELWLNRISEAAYRRRFPDSLGIPNGITPMAKPGETN